MSLYAKSENNVEIKMHDIDDNCAIRILILALELQASDILLFPVLNLCFFSLLGVFFRKVSGMD